MFANDVHLCDFDGKLVTVRRTTAMVMPDSQRIISMRTYTCTVYKDSIVLHIKRYVISVLMCDTLLGVN